MALPDRLAPLRLGANITVLPVIHGSGDYAVAVRRLLLEEPFRCLAVPLPPSFAAAVNAAIDELPSISVVLQREPRTFRAGDWSPDSEADDGPEEAAASYVPIDPCQPVIAALRVAREEHLPCVYIDCETAVYLPQTQTLPDPYALKQVSVAQFAAAALPALQAPQHLQHWQRVRHMARKLRELEVRRSPVLAVVSLLDWPWLREAYHDLVVAESSGADASLKANLGSVDDPSSNDNDDIDHEQDAAHETVHEEVEDVEHYSANTQTLLFLLGELPFVTGQYERARRELEEDSNLSIDGVKELILASRDHYRSELGRRARKLSPKVLQTYFQYVRNLSLMENRLTPSLYHLVTAGKQIGGDSFAISIAEIARAYPFAGRPRHPVIDLSVGKGRLPDGTVLSLKSRLPGQPLLWRTLQLKPNPPKPDQARWKLRWNPFQQCSWPPEDLVIEKFRTNVKDVALAMLGNDLARHEKFSTSLKDGLDIRETLRNWHTGDLYVKVLPPSRGRLDCVVMLFDVPADPRDYPWRVTWHAEHHDESTLALFASDFQKTLVGPGIGQAVYGGASFHFPPRPVPEIWTDRRFNFTTTLEERLIAAGCYHAREKHVAILCDNAPSVAWRQIAKRYGKKLVHVPLKRFSQETVQQLRTFHVLNGQQIRSFAAEFIRKN